MTDTAQPPKDLIGFLDFYLVQKAPFQIPENGKELLVKFGPWIAGILTLLLLPVLLFALGIGTMLMPFGGVGYASGFGFAAIGALVQMALTIAALPGLFARKKIGWTLIFYATLASFVFSVLSGSIIAPLLGALISLYILFQVRLKYS